MDAFLAKTFARPARDGGIWHWVFLGQGVDVSRVVIPILNESGELVAQAGLAIDGSEPE